MLSNAVPKCNPDRTLHADEISNFLEVSTQSVREVIEMNSFLKAVEGSTKCKSSVAVITVPVIKYCIVRDPMTDSKSSIELLRTIYEVSKNAWESLSQEGWWPGYQSHAEIFEDVENNFETLTNSVPIEDLKSFCDLIFLQPIGTFRDFCRAENKVREDENIRGGIPTLCGTRIGVYEAAGIANKDGIEMARESFPNLSEEDLEDAMLYAKIYPHSGKIEKYEYPGSELLDSKEVPLPSIENLR